MLALATALAVTGCASGPTEPVDRSLTLPGGEIPGNWRPDVMQPNRLQIPILAAVYDALVDYAPDGSVIPRLATGYEMSDDHMSIRVELRDDIDFADGTHMDAAGVEKYFDFLLASEAYQWRPQASSFGIEFTATGEYELEVTSTRPMFHPDNFVPDVVRQLFMYTPVASTAIVDDPEAGIDEPLGYGPYRIAEQSPGQELVFERTPDYYDSDAYDFDTITFKLSLVDEIAVLNALKSGQIDAAGVPASMVAEAEASGFTIASSSQSYYALIVRNAEASPFEPVRDVRVRQAMALAFDRQSIGEVLGAGYGQVSSQAFIEGQPAYVEGGDERYGYDLDQARDLMADAGYPDGFDLTIPSSADYANVEPIVQSALADIGIRVTFETFPDFGALVFDGIFSGNFPVTLYQVDNRNTLRLLDEPIGSRLFDENATVDELLETIRYGGSDESAAASKEIGEFLLDEAWYIPFFRVPSFTASESRVSVTMNDVFAPLLSDYKLAE
jgi:peptide/nickel transport system substrate-binding protein